MTKIMIGLEGLTVASDQFVNVHRHRPLRWLTRQIFVTFDRLLGLILLPFTHPKLRLGTIAALVLAMIWLLASGSGTESAFATVGRPLNNRAAFNWEAKLGAAADWTDPAALSAEEGMVRVRGLSLHRLTMGLKNYEMSFVAQANGRPIGWVMRAADPENYYVFKLIPRRGRSGAKWQFDLARYVVRGGRAPAGSTVNTVPLGVEVTESKAVRVTAHVTAEQVYTLEIGRAHV